MRRNLFRVPAIALLAIVVAIPLLSSGSSVRAASDAQIEEAVTKGLAWLDDQQHPTDGYFDSVSPVAATCLAVVKFEHRALDLDFTSPFDVGYAYHQTVEDGLDYVFDQMVSDANGVHIGGSVYNTGICMMTVAASAEPTKVVNTGASAVDGSTFKQVLQGMMDWMEFAQNDGTSGYECDEGGWGYTANYVGWSDNSNSGYATLGIAYAALMGVYPQAATLTKLTTFINNIQDSVSGGSFYGSCHVGNWANKNILKTGNLLFEMRMDERLEADATVQAAIGYIENNWNSVAVDVWNFPISWHSGGDPDKGYYQAMFTMMKGLEAYGIETLDGGIGDWFDEVSTYIYNDKVEPASGKWYWTGTGFGSPDWSGGDRVLETAWALLTLEKVVPPVGPPGVGGIVDIISADMSDSLVSSADEGSAGSSVPYSLGLAGAAAAAIVVVAGALYARRRWLR